MAREYNYAWPATGIHKEEMSLLHSVRESLPERIPITRLLAKAVRVAYGSESKICINHNQQ